MTRRGAAPEGLLAGTSGGRINGESEPTIADSGLSAHLVDLLAREGVRTLADWRRLGKRRWSIFGVTTAVAKMLDAFAQRRP